MVTGSSRDKGHDKTNSDLEEGGQAVKTRGEGVSVVVQGKRI